MLVSQTLCWRSAGHPPTPRSTHGRPSVRSAAEICSKLVEIIDSARVSGCPPQHRIIGPHPFPPLAFLSPPQLPPPPPSSTTFHPSFSGCRLAGWLAGWACGSPSFRKLPDRARLHLLLGTPGQFPRSPWAAAWQLLGSSRASLGKLLSALGPQGFRIYSASDLNTYLLTRQSNLLSRQGRPPQGSPAPCTLSE